MTAQFRKVAPAAVVSSRWIMMATSASVPPIVEIFHVGMCDVTKLDSAIELMLEVAAHSGHAAVIGDVHGTPIGIVWTPDEPQKLEGARAQRLLKLAKEITG